jgi:hypothetical protein
MVRLRVAPPENGAKYEPYSLLARRNGGFFIRDATHGQSWLTRANKSAFPQRDAIIGHPGQNQHGASGATQSRCACRSGAGHPGLPVGGCEHAPLTLHRRKHGKISVSFGRQPWPVGAEFSPPPLRSDPDDAEDDPSAPWPTWPRQRGSRGCLRRDRGAPW